MPKKQPPHANTNAVSTAEVVGMAAESLWNHKLRTGLTMLGVIIGISSVISITSVGQGVQKSTEQQIQALGTNVMLVLAGASTTGGGINQGVGSASTLTWEDAKAVAQQAPAAIGVTAFLQRQFQVVYGGQNISTSVLGTDLYYSEVKNIRPQVGQFFTQADLDAAQPVVVLGSKVRDQLFGAEVNPVGADIRIQRQSYKVLGVMEPKGAVGGQDQDDRVYVPLTNMSARLVGNNALT
ncbi:hypothetical protein DSM107010_18440 [Chroococcidiopsis cubana SAG 39.79]|uniref:MacB-like periplasmic core domain-containing protein n=3 Tax=Chroococcidiopsis TaxID=54298 RepID=A0AB37UNR3_9CYAN|nr:ABC transporter permease [Chroococcidiopsis cubana]RUT12998.1 hypothetical protein DSM107010_18440 [Chroococcidiopsis cubana SAG 39.79]